MNNFNTIGVDLAKNVIQVSIVSNNNKELKNKELTRKKFSEFLAKQNPSLVAIEACATAHYWSRVAIRHGHDAKKHHHLSLKRIDARLDFANCYWQIGLLYFL